MPTFAVAELEALAGRALERAGAGAAMAEATARALVHADARGLASHGVARVGQYATHLANGRADGLAQPAIVKSKGGAALIDARCGLAFPACALAVDEVIGRARLHGVAFAGVTNSHHFGVAAYHRSDARAVPIYARCGLAFPACALSVDEVIGRARLHGVAFAGVTNSHHFGVAAYHISEAAA